MLYHLLRLRLCQCYQADNSIMEIRSCQLICLQKSHGAILLPDGTPITIGRSPETRIIDPRCSRNQVQLTADYKNYKVKVKQLGANNSSIDGIDILQNEEADMGKDSILFILSGQFPHRVNFNTENPSKPDSNAQKKSSDVTEKNVSSVKEKVNPASDVSEKKFSSAKEKDNPSKSSSKRHSTDVSDYPKNKKLKTSNGNFNKDDADKKIKTEKNHNVKVKTEVQISKSDAFKSSKDEDEHEKVVTAKLEFIKEQVMKQKSSTAPTQNNKKEKPTSSPALPSLGKSSSATVGKTSSSSPTPANENTWTNHEHLYVFTSKGVKPSTKIAAFDLDGTIILTKSGRTFPLDNNDWKIIFPDVFNELKKLNQDKYKIVIFTNQLGVSKGKTKIDELKAKIENVVAKLQVPVQVFIATHDGKYRKPSCGMWEKLKNDYNGGIKIDRKESFYVGDAAGRPANWAPKKKKDFSSSDRLFALNIDMAFKTPEEYFQKQKPAPFIMPAFDPRNIASKDPLLSSKSKLVADEKEVVVLVGFPASGKSFFANEVMKPKGYVVVNRDTLGTWQKCVKAVTQSLVNSSVVVDNTNLSKDERARYVECAKKVQVPCRCFVFTTTIEHCRHNEKFRQITDESHAKINEMIFNKVKSKFQEPSMSEGFSEIVQVNFVPKFSSSSLESKYRKFLLEK
ncbi:unnamed protein product [Lymnaea stagnalis]|uniref:PNK FHA domain-containing protein n=1 Tax=Lymnaea stagnalis TaxID=6523 RepID=A0AAV2IM77_LYMST